MVDQLPLVVEQGADPAVAGAADDDLADAEGPLLDQHGRHHAPALGERGLQAGALGRPVRVGLELVQFGDGLERQEQLGDALAGRRRGLDDLDVPTPLDRVEALLRQLAVDLAEIGGIVDVGQVDLVERHDDRHLGRLGVGDRLHGLGHDAVVGGNDQHDDVGDIGTAGAHRGECLVAGRIDECDGPVVGLDLVSADVLRDAATLGVDHVRLADPVQQRGLAVVDMPKNRDNRGPGHEILRVAGLGEGRDHLLFRGGLVDHLELDAELHGEHDGEVFLQGGVDGQELVQAHQLAEQIAVLDADRFGKGPHADRRLDLGARLASGGQHGAMPTPGLLRTARAPELLILAGEQCGGGYGGCDPAFAGPLVPLGPAAGPIGGRAQAGAFVLAIFFFIHRRGRRGCRRGQARPDAPGLRSGGRATRARWASVSDTARRLAAPAAGRRPGSGAGRRLEHLEPPLAHHLHHLVPRHLLLGTLGLGPGGRDLALRASRSRRRRDVLGHRGQRPTGRARTFATATVAAGSFDGAARLGGRRCRRSTPSRRHDADPARRHVLVRTHRLETLTTWCPG